VQGGGAGDKLLSRNHIRSNGTMREIGGRASWRSLAEAAIASAGVVGAAWWVDARRRGRDARRMHRSLVDLLLNALTADDASTGRHSRRVADLSYALAAARGYRRADLARLRVAALLHDLGKMDDRFFDIVRSARKLTPEQRTEMEQHPRESAHILVPLEKLHPGIGRIVACHHERWDGRGYPAGLEGAAIPEEARIIAIADVFDALSQRRSYHEPMPVEDVLEELARSAGSQFDPELVALSQTRPVLQRWRAIAQEGLVEEERARPAQEAQDARQAARASKPAD
jgi:putative nucleotidyltransferase with HDIG domain